MDKKLAGLIFSVLIFAALSVTAFADGTERELTIASTEDFLAFADACRTDEYSLGLTVNLTADINLGGRSVVVPVFSGVFNGNGYTVSNYKINTKTASAALFGYVTAGGEINDLNAKGTVAPMGTETEAAGIVAYNEGKISGCTFSGSVTGTKNAGGIAGVSSGSIESCKNYGDINKNAKNIGLRIKDLKAMKYRDPSVSALSYIMQAITGKLNSPVDTGGIAGESSGSISNCENYGTIGNAKNGYDVGGIAGSSSGRILRCTNEGTVSGGENVGGIAGQMQPYVATETLTDSLEEVQEDINDILDAVRETTGDVDSMTDNISASLDTVLDSLDLVLSDASRLTDALTAAVNTKLDEINQIKNVANITIDEVGEITGDVVYIKDAVAGAKGDIDKTISASREYGNAIIAARSSQSEADEAQAAADKAQAEADSLQETYDKQHQPGYVPEEGEQIITEAEVEEAQNNATTAEIAASDAEEAAGKAAEEANAALTEVYKDISQVQEDLTGAVGKIGDIVDDVDQLVLDLDGNLAAVELSGLSSDINYNVKKMTTDIKGITSALKSVKNQIALVERSITTDIRMITNLVQKTVDSTFNVIYSVTDNELSVSGIVTDRSTEMYNDKRHNGVIYLCANRAKITGKQNVGGIIGAVSIATVYSFTGNDTNGLIINDDGEVSETSLLKKFIYRADITSCENTGDVEALDVYAGGIAGKMSIGAVYDCTVDGISVSALSFGGGIAGSLHGTIESCEATSVVLEGNTYLGGIVGTGTKSNTMSGSSMVKNCYASVTADDDCQFVGAISGTDTGDYVNNFFTAENLNGFDEYSRVGMAEPK